MQWASAVLYLDGKLEDLIVNHKEFRAFILTARAKNILDEFKVPALP